LERSKETHALGRPGSYSSFELNKSIW